MKFSNEFKRWFIHFLVIVVACFGLNTLLMTGAMWLVVPMSCLESAVFGLLMIPHLNYYFGKV